MHRFVKTAGLALAVLLILAVGTVQAQVVVYYPPQPTVTYYAAPPSTVVYYPPALRSVSYYPPVTTTVYSAPLATTVYSPALVPPGYYTTRSYVGFGIFRPRGVYTQNYYTPVLTTAPVTTYYRFWP